MKIIAQQRLLIWVIACVMLAACGSPEGAADATSVPPATQNEVIAEATDTSTVTVTPSATRRPTRTPRPTQTPTVTPTPIPSVAEFPPGLVYSTRSRESEAIWVVDAAGLPRIIHEVPLDPNYYTPLIQFDVSPDGTQLFHDAHADIWVLDITTSSITIITETADRWEWDPIWWAGLTDSILFRTALRGETGSISDGKIAFTNINGDYEELGAGWIFAPRPDGQTILSASLIEYRLGGGSREYQWADLGLERYRREDGSLWAEALSWSPDGNTLALAIVGQFEDQGMGIVTVDWTTREPTVIYAFDHPGGEYVLTESMPKWSPDGSWFVFRAYYPNTMPYGVSLFLWDGAAVRDLTGSLNTRVASAPAVSRDGQWVAVKLLEANNPPFYQQLIVMRVGEWIPLRVPIDAALNIADIGWAEPPE